MIPTISQILQVEFYDSSNDMIEEEENMAPEPSVETTGDVSPPDTARSTLSRYNQVYTRVLTRVQLTSGHELSSSSPVESIRVTIWVGGGGGVHTGGESGLNPG